MSQLLSFSNANSSQHLFELPRCFYSTQASIRIIAEQTPIVCPNPFNCWNMIPCWALWKSSLFRLRKKAIFKIQPWPSILKHKKHKTRRKIFPYFLSYAFEVLLQRRVEEKKCLGIINEITKCTFQITHKFLLERKQKMIFWGGYIHVLKHCGNWRIFLPLSDFK